MEIDVSDQTYSFPSRVHRLSNHFTPEWVSVHSLVSDWCGHWWIGRGPAQTGPDSVLEAFFAGVYGAADDICRNVCFGECGKYAYAVVEMPSEVHGDRETGSVWYIR